MSTWNQYPVDYRQNEVQAILAAARAGECTAISGLSGSGKSNLLGFLANRIIPAPGQPDFVLVDCNRLPPAGSGVDILPSDLFGLIGAALTGQPTIPLTFDLLSAAIGRRLAASQPQRGLCLLFDRFEIVAGVAGDAQAEKHFAPLASNLRALRDLYKYDLTYVIAARRPIPQRNELAELFFAHSFWLGPLSPSDAAWTVTRYASRLNLNWDAGLSSRLVELTGGYPAFLKAACEACAAGCPVELPGLAAHPAVSRRLAEFQADCPTPAEITASRLNGLPLLQFAVPDKISDLPGPKPGAELTAKEHLLWTYFLAHPRQVCEKDELIHAVWPEDVIFQTGIRDDSLAQLVRRLREKVEKEPSNPQFIHTVPGRGYRYDP